MSARLHLAPLAALLLAAAAARAAEPSVSELRQADGVSLIRINGVQAPYRIDLARHFAPATNHDARIARWASYRYGGFFCFNDNQFGGGEYSKNTDPLRYRPTNLDVAGWAAAMKVAGMKYAVLTTRHTSGFLLWDSPTTQFDVAASGNTTDVCHAFADECRKAGIAPGFYYCLWGGSWMPHPNARAIILAQLHELATRFGEIPYFWIDMGNWRPADLAPQEIYDAIRSEQPDAVVMLNQHIQDGAQLRYFPTDVLNGEVHLPPATGQVAYRRVGDRRHYLPFEFEPVSQRIGKGTTTPWGPVGAWFTVQDSRPIPPLDVFGWIKESCDRGAANILLALSADHTGAMRAEDVAQLSELGRMLSKAGLLEVPPPQPPPPESLALGRPCRASGVWDDQVDRYGPAAAFDGDAATRWGGARGSTNGWIEVDLGLPQAVSRAVVHEGWERARRFAIRYRAGDTWRDAAAGTAIGPALALPFAPVTAQVFRLDITEAIDVPTIWEFQLFAPPPQDQGAPP